MGLFEDLLDAGAEFVEDTIDAVADAGEDVVEWVEDTATEAGEAVEEFVEDSVDFVVGVGAAAVEMATDALRLASELVVAVGRANVDAMYELGRSVPGLELLVGGAEVFETLVEDFAAATLGPESFVRNPVDPASDRPETWRPQFHFSPLEGWLNDPCGLTTTSVGVGQKRFHLGAQHIPGRRNFEYSEVEWLGAVAPDALRWSEHRDASLSEELLVSSTEGHAALAAGVAGGAVVGLTVVGVANAVTLGLVPAAAGASGLAAGLATYLLTTMEAQDADTAYVPFTGSAITDVDNDSLLFDDAASSRLIAFHTRASSRTLLPFEQQQHLAISDDHGRSWTMVDETPAVATSLADLTQFRDPKVVRMPASTGSMRWTMAVAAGRSIRFFESDDLVAWHPTPTAQFDLAPLLGVRDVVECPDLYPLALPDGTGHAWVLVFSVARLLGDMSLLTDRGAFYLVGDFDHINGFVPHASFVESGPRPLDWGPDVYASQTWFDHEAPVVPESRTSIAWMDNWGYAQRLPTDPWRGQMTIPRNVSLRADEVGDIDIAQHPVALDALRDRILIADGGGETVEGDVRLDEMVGNQWELDVVFDVIEASEIRIELCRGGGERLTVGWSRTRNELFVDRFISGQRVSGAYRNCTAAPAARNGRCHAPLRRVDGQLGLKILVDHCSVEVFAHDGSATLTALNFPDPGNDAVHIVTRGGSARVASLEAFALDTIWT